LSADAPASARVPDDELTPALERELAEHFGAARRIRSLERAASKFQTSFTLEDVFVTFDDGDSVSLVFKNVGAGGLSERARAAKPMFLYDPEREIEVYRLLLPRASLGTADCYGAVADAAVDRYWLFIENVPGVALWQIGELETWRNVARWLASFHDAFAADHGIRDASHLLRHDSGFYRAWPERALSFTQPADAGRRRALERLAERYDEVVRRLESLPATFIHGEFYASNVLVDAGPPSPRVCPIDWENAAIGPGLLDLAALTTGNWSDSERESLALAYRDALATVSGGALPEHEFLSALDWCYLHLAVQWLGWAPEWRAPRAHRYDWLAEALRLADKLGLA
jgi:aminoglycoside phosphotransferase (APT) family kinase protein